MDRTITKRYTSPRVLQETEILLERDFLTGSLVDNIESVTTTGQEVETFDFSETQFNHNWEDE